MRSTVSSCGSIVALGTYINNPSTSLYPTFFCYPQTKKYAHVKDKEKAMDLEAYISPEVMNKVHTLSVQMNAGFFSLFSNQ